MELFKLEKISQESYFEQLRMKILSVECPICGEQFSTNDVHLSIHNDIQHDGHREFKAITVDGNNYFLTCHLCKSVLNHGFRKVIGQKSMTKDNWT